VSDAASGVVASIRAAAAPEPAVSAAVILLFIIIPFGE
jgi:hypothetical protein